MLRILIITGLLAAIGAGIGVGGSAQAQSMGRLFIEPSERMRLDQLRKTSNGGEPSVTAQSPSVEQQPVLDQITLNGYVIRSSGKSTTWINRVSHDEHDRGGNQLIVQQRPNHAPSVIIQTQPGKVVSLKAGETVDVHTGVVNEVYEPASTGMPNPAMPAGKP